eukprot:CAMPEP_0206300052 /NCGR_PEP_ID=MMETSP0106_2-20121207/7503_1 /ASSEMBLY_ACC=CAM_ASM_000206 /TAXON_ID=81532 /ORGANISM="Acanthoeca-like sp., Strain 10tr" /LENGTH=1043 /DNA_ID=CAMNT_0053730765 /DNA_START=38 /DNA_END=3170 /DNA_ORIENTATION=-
MAISVGPGRPSAPDSWREPVHGMTPIPFAAIDGSHTTVWGAGPSASGPAVGTSRPHVLQLDNPDPFAGYSFTTTAGPRAWQLLCDGVPIASEANVQYGVHTNHVNVRTAPHDGFSVCLNSTRTCQTLQLRISDWHSGAPGLREFRLHPDAASPAAAVAAASQPFHPAPAVPTSNPATAGMAVRVHHFEMGGAGGGLFASAAAWTLRPSGQGGTHNLTPRRVYHAACGDKVFVAWARHDAMAPTQWPNVMKEWSVGRLSTFRMDPDGSLTSVSDVELPECTDMGAIATSADCRLVSALCRTNLSHSASAVPGATDFVDANRNADGSAQFGWEDSGDADYMSSRQISHMWLYEWTDGVVSPRPTTRTLINSAIGGWNFGHWELGLNADASVYSFDLKVSLGGHEGSTNAAMHRRTKTWVRGLSAGWACGSGHVLGNRLQYNTALDRWGRACWVDLNADGGPAAPPLDGFDSLNVGTVGGTHGPQTEVLKMRRDGYGNWHGYGGLGAIVSLGADGFLLAGVRAGLNRSAPSEAHPAFHDCDTAGLLRVPPQGPSHFRAHRGQPGFDWNWFGDAALFAESYPGNDRRVTFANAANFGRGGENASEVLVGWAERWRWNSARAGGTDHFVLSRATRDGTLIGQPWALHGGPGSVSPEATGWGEDNNWVNVPSSGCVVFSHVWRGDDGPGSQPYQPDWRGSPEGYTSRLTLTSVCPAAGYTPPDPRNRPTPLRFRRGYDCDGTAVQQDGGGGPSSQEDSASGSGALSDGAVAAIVVVLLGVTAVGVLAVVRWRRKPPNGSHGRGGGRAVISVEHIEHGPAAGHGLVRVEVNPIHALHIEGPAVGDGRASGPEAARRPRPAAAHHPSGGRRGAPFRPAPPPPSVAARATAVRQCPWTGPPHPLRPPPPRAPPARTSGGGTFRPPLARGGDRSGRPTVPTKAPLTVAASRCQGHRPPITARAAAPPVAPRPTTGRSVQDGTAATAPRLPPTLSTGSTGYAVAASGQRQPSGPRVSATDELRAALHAVGSQQLSTLRPQALSARRATAESDAP